MVFSGADRNESGYGGTGISIFYRVFDAGQLKDIRVNASCFHHTGKDALIHIGNGLTQVGLMFQCQGKQQPKQEFVLGLAFLGASIQLGFQIGLVSQHCKMPAGYLLGRLYRFQALVVLCQCLRKGLEISFRRRSANTQIFIKRHFRTGSLGRLCGFLCS